MLTPKKWWQIQFLKNKLKKFVYIYIFKFSGKLKSYRKGRRKWWSLFHFLISCFILFKKSTFKIFVVKVVLNLLEEVTYQANHLNIKYNKERFLMFGKNTKKWFNVTIDFSKRQKNKPGIYSPIYYSHSLSILCQCVLRTF